MAVDPFLLDYDADELAAAAEFLANWLPFLTRGLGDGCAAALRRRVQSINPGRSLETLDPIWHSVPAPVVVTGWDAPAEVIHAPLPTGWDAPPQVALQLVPVHNGSNEDVSMNNTGALGSQSQQQLTEIKHSMVEQLEHDYLQSQHPSYPPETSTCRSSYRDEDRVPPPRINNMDRGRGSAARWSKPLSSDRGLLGPGPGQVNTDMFVGRSLREGIHDVRSARLDGSGEQRGWRGHLEQKQSMVSSNRNVQAEDAFLLDEGSNQGYSGRRSMIEQQQTVSRRDGSMLGAWDSNRL